ncbi:hypothetical protein [Acidisphaera sp. L21]|uniref:hypothetical protein n=1 Tax=Acidisphaera sp. L21 TaxID=1641851 RepID=UPI00131D3A4A|nr:hypothetical protein [Acidisphaera sp. L21]
MATSPKEAAAALIGGLYAVDFDQPMPNAAPPLTTYAASRGGVPGFMAVAVSRGWPARGRALGAVSNLGTPHMLPPVAHGPTTMPGGETGYFVICPAPPGPSLLANLRAWPEAELTDFVLKPMALALGELQARDVTHRAIRPDNLFQSAPRTPVTLGCAWATPPACHQPSWMEPAYSAVCLPAGRGDGRIADDVYSLGALMVMLALGANPVEGVPDEEVLRNKLEFGSYSAIVGNHRLPPILVDLVRGMLADDPEHRPSPALLANPAAARARRIAARPARRAQRPIEVGGQHAWTSRMLAHALMRAPNAASPMLRNGTIDRWLRRGVGDVTAASAIDEAARMRDAEVLAADGKADAMLITRSIALLDPAAPLVWRGLAIWPDGLANALDNALHFAPEQAEALAEIATAQVPTAWVEKRGGGRDATVSRLEGLETRHWFTGSRTGAGAWRLSYHLNPMVPCESPATARAWVVRLADILPALEATAARSPRGDQPLVDRQIATFIEARRDERLDVDLSRLAGAMTAPDLLSQLRLLARLQGKLSTTDLPNLSRWAADAVQPMLQHFSSRSRRQRLAERLSALAQAGQLAPMAAMLDDEPEQESDKHGLAGAKARLAEIEAALAEWSELAEIKAAQARRVGHEVADGVGLLACVVALGFAVFG